MGFPSRKVPAPDRAPGHIATSKDHGRPGAPAGWLAAGAVLFAVSVLVYRQLLSANPILWGHTDEWVYRAAGLVVRQHPADVYRTLLGEPGAQKLPFTYPPFAALLFSLGSSASFAVWQGVLVVVNVLLLPVILYLCLHISGRRGITGAAQAFALAAAALWLEPVYMTMYFGQINLVLLALAIADLALPDSCRWKGIGVGLAAGLKLTPLIFIPYLLATRRIRAGLVALLTFAATVAIGFGVLPTASRGFWSGNLASRGNSMLQNQSINGLLERLLPGHPDAHTLWVILALTVGLAGLAAAVVASRRGLELLGIVLTALTGLLISPISWTHHWVWALLPGLALMVAGARRGTAQDVAVVRTRDWVARAAGLTVLLVLFGEWPRPGLVGRVREWLPAGFLRFAPHGNGLEYTWHGWWLLVGNMYLLLAALAMIGAAWYLFAVRRPGLRHPR